MNVREPGESEIASSTSEFGFNLIEFIGELCTSAFTGVVTFYLCEAAQFPPVLTAALVGISGHMGSRGLFLIEKHLTNKLK